MENAVSCLWVWFLGVSCARLAWFFAQIACFSWFEGSCAIERLTGFNKEIYGVSNVFEGTLMLVVLYMVMVNNYPTDCCGLAFAGSTGPLETHLSYTPSTYGTALLGCASQQPTSRLSDDSF